MSLLPNSDHDAIEKFYETFLSLNLQDNSNKSELISELSSNSVLIKHPPNKIILGKGRTNSDIYFLVRGAVLIIDEGLELYRLSRLGDILGEVFHTKESNYSVQTCQEVYIIELSRSSLKSYPLNLQLAIYLAIIKNLNDKHYMLIGNETENLNLILNFEKNSSHQLKTIKTWLAQLEVKLTNISSEILKFQNKVLINTITQLQKEIKYSIYIFDSNLSLLQNLKKSFTTPNTKSHKLK